MASGIQGFWEGRRPAKVRGRAQRTLLFPNGQREGTLGHFWGIFQGPVLGGWSVNKPPPLWFITWWPLSLSPGRGSTRQSGGHRSGQEGSCLGPSCDLQHCGFWSWVCALCWVRVGVGGLLSQCHSPPRNPCPVRAEDLLLQLPADWLDGICLGFPHGLVRG